MLWLWMALSAAGGAAVMYVLAQQRFAAAKIVLQSVIDQERERVAERQAELVELRTAADVLRGTNSDLAQKVASLGAEKNAEEQRLLDYQESMAKSEQRLREAFAELSRQSLKQNAEQFTAFAEQRFKQLTSESNHTLEQRKTEIATLLQPMNQTLKQYQDHLQQLEKTRTEAYATLREQLGSVAATQQTLSKETSQLVLALRKPQGRGRWGELTLERLFEMAGLTEHVSFSSQVSVDSDAGRRRPDCIVRLPSEREVIVDCKAVLDAFLDAASATEDADRDRLLTRHAQQVRSRVQELSQKAYWNEFGKSADYVVMFLPGEAFLYAAVERDPKLIEDALKSNVIVASPTTLLGLLKVIELGWRQKQVEDNAQEIQNLAVELANRVATMANHFEKLGSAIESAGKVYNDTLGSLERNVFSQVRRITKLGAKASKALPTPGSVEVTIRARNAKSWDGLPEAETAD